MPLTGCVDISISLVCSSLRAVIDVDKHAREPVMHLPKRLYILPSTLWHVYVARWGDRLLCMCSRSDVAKGRPNNTCNSKGGLVSPTSHVERVRKVEPVAGTVKGCKHRVWGEHS